MTKDNFKNIERIIYEISPRKAEEGLIKAVKTLTKNQLIELLIKIGAKYWTEDNIVDSKRLFKKILRLNPKKNDEAEAYLYLGLVAIDEEKFLDGITLFEKVLELTKDKWLIASAYDGISSCYYSIPDREKSIYFAKKSLKYYDLRKKNQISYYYDNIERIVENYLLMGKIEEANKIINRVLSDKRSPRKTISELYSDIGDYYYKSKQWGRAIENYNNSLRYFDSTCTETKGRILMYLASCYEHVGDHAKAETSYTYSLEFLKEASDSIFVKNRLKEIKKN